MGRNKGGENGWIEKEVLEAKRRCLEEWPDHASSVLAGLRGFRCGAGLRREEVEGRWRQGMERLEEVDGG